jgi:hypothetical protein
MLPGFFLIFVQHITIYGRIDGACLVIASAAANDAQYSIIPSISGVMLYSAPSVRGNPIPDVLPLT